MELILTIAGIHLLACLSPGPDVFLVVLNSLRHGWRTGVVTTGGILTGVSLHITLGITGISYLLSQGESVRMAVALAGGAWLMFLGIKGLLHWKAAGPARREPEIPSPARLDFSSAWLQGLLVNLLNPKAFLFFVSLFSVMLGPAVETPTKVIAGATMIGVQALAFSAVAVLVDRTSFKSGWKKVQAWLDLAISVILFGIGAWIWLGTLF